MPDAAPPTPVLHGLTVDVEDWFHVLQVAQAPQPAQWTELESRVARNTLRLLDVFDRHAAKATFFSLGWVAQTCPDLIAEIVRRGHELGSHSHMHQLVGELGPDAFARDLDLSLQALHKASGRDVNCFRAPGFSIGDDQTWAFAILASRGITLDASLFLARRAHGGIALQRQRPFDVVLPDGRKIVEVATVPRMVAGRELPFSGGGYLRLLPWPVLRSCFDACERAQTPAIAYLHPREIDPDQPRMPLNLRRRFKYYVGLDGTLAKLERLLQRYHWGTLSQVAAAVPRDRPVYLGQPSMA